MYQINESGFRPLLCTSDVCRRQILTTKVDPRTVKVEIFLMAVDPYYIGIQMNWEELAKTFMMISR